MLRVQSKGETQMEMENALNNSQGVLNTMTY